MRKSLAIAGMLFLSGLLLAPAFADTPSMPSERQQRRMHKDEVKAAVKKGNTAPTKKMKAKEQKPAKAKMDQGSVK